MATSIQSADADLFETAWKIAKRLSADFLDNKSHYLSNDYQESEVRKDFIDKIFSALGWDVDHNFQLDPYRQEVKIEKSAKGERGKADYAFSLSPFFHRVRFFVEAKRPQSDIATPDNCFQAIRYSWPRRVPIAVLTDFYNIHIIDSRFRPSIGSATSRVVRTWNCSQFGAREKFAEIYWLLSREAVVADSIERFADEHLPAQQVAVRQYRLFPSDTREFDDDFLAKLDEWREVKPALAGVLINQSKEPDAGPHVRSSGEIAITAPFVEIVDPLSTNPSSTLRQKSLFGACGSRSPPTHR
jgi:adenine-specific DNA-methyltransferase